MNNAELAEWLKDRPELNRGLADVLGPVFVELFQRLDMISMRLSDLEKRP